MRLGIQFTALDAATEEAVRALCKEMEEPAERDEQAPCDPAILEARLDL